MGSVINVAVRHVYSLPFCVAASSVTMNQGQLVSTISGTILNEAIFWLRAVLLGAQLLFLYDLLRIFRRVIIHKKAITIGLEDFLYWLVSACLIFRLLYRFNYGVIRWFAVLAVLTGMLLYHQTLSKPFVSYTSKWLKIALNILKRPFVCIFRKFQKAQKRVISRVQVWEVKMNKNLTERKQVKSHQ